MYYSSERKEIELKKNINRIDKAKMGKDQSINSIKKHFLH